MWNINDLSRKRIYFSFIGLCIFILFTIFNTSQYGASLSWIIVPSSLIVFGFLLNRSYSIKRSNALIFFMWTSYFISSLFSEYIEIHRDILTFFILCIVYICAVSIKYTANDINKLLKFYIFLAEICSILVIYNWITGNYYVAFYQRSSLQFMGVYKDPNYVMASIIPAMYFLINKLFQEKRIIIKMISLIGVLIMLTAMIASGTRAAMLSVFFAVFIEFLLDKKRDRRSKIKVLLGILLLFIVVVILAKHFLPEQALSRIFKGDDSRTGLWESALIVFKKHPFFGGGFGATSMYTLKNAGNYTHNVYLDILCDSGICGFFFFILFFIKNCVLFHHNEFSFFTGMIIVCMLPMFFINGFNTATFYLPIILLTIIKNYITEYGDVNKLLC